MRVMIRGLDANSRISIMRRSSANEEYLKWEIDYDYEMHQARMAVWDTPLGEELLRLRSLWEKRGVPEKVEQYQEGIIERTVFSDGSMTERWDKESDRESFNYFYRYARGG